MRFSDDSCPETRSVARSDSPLASFTSALEEKPIWTGLFENLRDLFFPLPLPPLELTSTPIPVPDRMAVKTSRWAVGTSTFVNGGALAIVLLLGMRAVMHPVPRPDPGHHVDLSGLTFFAKSQAGGGGGGGGANDLIDPILGRTPRFDMKPITPPQIPMLDHPKLTIEPAIAVPPDIRLPDNPLLPNVGVHTSTNVRLASAGSGTEAGLGSGAHGGDGPGDGNGNGPGSDRGAGNGIYRPGIGGVTNPVPIVTPVAEFSDEARRAKYQGVCLIAIVVDAHGYPQNPRVVRSLGMGLDEKALDAVRRYRFKPAMKDGRPVAAMITVEVNFRLY